VQADNPVNVEIADVPALVEAVTGLSIIGGGYDGIDGFHFDLSDGRVLVITGVFVVGLCRVSKEEIH
jgi:hypothetical protein